MWGVGRELDLKLGGGGENGKFSGSLIGHAICLLRPCIHCSFVAVCSVQVLR